MSPPPRSEKTSRFFRDSHTQERQVWPFSRLEDRIGTDFHFTHKTPRDKRTSHGETGLESRRYKMSDGIGNKGRQSTEGTGRTCRQNGNRLAETARLSSAATELCTKN
jgi:hypothetical protein